MSCSIRKLRGEASTLRIHGQMATQDRREWTVPATKFCERLSELTVSHRFELPARYRLQFETENDSAENLHRSQLNRSNSCAVRLRIPCSFLVSNEIQAGLKPCSARPSPVILWQARLVVVPLIDRTLAEDCFPSVHSVLLSGYV